MTIEKEYFICIQQQHVTLRFVKFSLKFSSRDPRCRRRRGGNIIFCNMRKQDGTKSRYCSFNGDVALRGYRFAHGGSPGVVKTGVSVQARTIRVTGTAHGHRYSSRRPAAFHHSFISAASYAIYCLHPLGPPSLLSKSFREIMRHFVFAFPRYRDKTKRFIVRSRYLLIRLGRLIEDRRIYYWLVKLVTMVFHSGLTMITKVSSLTSIPFAMDVWE